jgi:hypothetical protein
MFTKNLSIPPDFVEYQAEVTVNIATYVCLQSLSIIGLTLQGMCWEQRNRFDT